MNPPKQDASSPWTQLMPLVDAAVTSLPKRYRDIVVMRYFERQEAAQIAQRLGLSQDAVRKRLSRGVAELREILLARGLTLEGGAIVTAIATHAVQPSPGTSAGLSAAIAHAPATSAASTLAHGALRTLQFTKLKLAAVVVATIGIVTVGSVAAIKAYELRSPVVVPMNPAASPPAVVSAPPRAQSSTPLILAVERANVAEVKRLLADGADPNEVPARGDKNVALIHAFAVREPRLSQIVGSLVEHGADVNVRHTQWGYTPIYMAAASGSATCVKYLLAHGADPTVVSNSGRTPLDRAKEKGDSEIIALLQKAVAEQSKRAR
jgi:hypothetical protein